MGRARGLVVWLGIILVISVGAFLVRQFVAGGGLGVGDCFDPPATSGQTVKNIAHRPCADSHGGEVIFVGTITDLTDFPTDEQLQVFIADNCLPAYTAYTGADLFTVDGADMGYLSPTADGWSNGDREIVCYATRLDGAPTKGSVRKT